MLVSWYAQLNTLQALLANNTHYTLKRCPRVAFLFFKLYFYVTIQCVFFCGEKGINPCGF